jgi:hypothetical protein
MWKPDRLGEPIAERRFKLHRRGVRPKTVRVRFGKPVRARKPERGDPWWCPVEITGLKSRSFTPVAGEDSLQALVLALKYVTRVLPAEARRMSGRIEWLGEQERPVFADTFMLRAYEKAVSNLKSGLKLSAPARQAIDRKSCQTTQGAREDEPPARHVRLSKDASVAMVAV